MRHVVRKSIKRGRCVALDQYYKSYTPDKVFNNVSKEMLMAMFVKS